jgi:hypothetical protein
VLGFNVRSDYRGSAVIICYEDCGKVYLSLDYRPTRFSID